MNKRMIAGMLDAVSISGQIIAAEPAVESWRNYVGEPVFQMSAKNSFDRKYLRRCEIDFARFPVAVLESDDWGCCSGRLETPSDLEKLFLLLESIRGANGLPAVLTAFTCMGNPDFAAIEKSGFTRYSDIAIDEGFPPPWNGTGTIDKMREGIKRGVWRPEYHALLHHVSPRLWLQLLRGKGPESDIARERFRRNCFSQPSHLPEYAGFTVREQNDMIRLGLGRFRRTFGFAARAAVTRDAYPETVVLWAANGIEVVPLINWRRNSGAVTLYQNKPWNFQDMYAKMGDFGSSTGVVYLTRNAFFEKNADCREVFTAVERAWKILKEPAVISCHRAGLLDPERQKEFRKLLRTITAAGGVIITSAELGDLYRQGWFVRAGILHKYAEVSCPYSAGVSLATGKQEKITEKSLGHFRIEKQ